MNVLWMFYVTLCISASWSLCNVRTMGTYYGCSMSLCASVLHGVCVMSGPWERIMDVLCHSVRQCFMESV